MKYRIVNPDDTEVGTGMPDGYAVREVAIDLAGRIARETGVALRVKWGHEVIWSYQQGEYRR